jgi:molecular chaperone GrpE
MAADRSAPETEEGTVDDRDADVVDAEVVDETDSGDAEGDGPAAADVDDEASDLDADEQVVRERAEYLDALRRLQADFENYRKRAFKQQSDAIEFATGRLVEDLLPVLDACEAGIEHGDEGVTAVFTALLGALERSGLQRVDPVGQPFDPNTHEAVLHEPGEGGDEPVVVEVMRPGYLWKERTLRAAMVKVRG